ncbi:hypothetical protein IWX47DRAFT_677914 [Phyllosticta citricarpa]|uniref:Secreted protein n=1 Tax=Phyllosticta citricarpa TaxID=55181 RepID=A0ABR1L3U0_9PEZI
MTRLQSWWWWWWWWWVEPTSGRHKISQLAAQPGPLATTRTTPRTGPHSEHCRLHHLFVPITRSWIASKSSSLSLPWQATPPVEEPATTGPAQTSMHALLQHGAVLKMLSLTTHSDEASSL